MIKGKINFFGREIKFGHVGMSMTLTIPEVDAIATCECQKAFRGDSINDAVLAWTRHLTTDHREDDWA